MYKLNLASICIQPMAERKIVSCATGSLIRRNGNFYLLTAWHCLTGCNPYTLNPISPNRQVKPDSVQLRVPILVKDKNGNESFLSELFSIPLYDVSGTPNWLVHPDTGSGKDIAILPVPPYYCLRDDYLGTDKSIVTPECENEPDMLFRAGVELTINGFMFGPELFPTWKRATAASEPFLVTQNFDQFYSVDSSTREGLSGAPVFCIGHGTYTDSEGANVVRRDISRRPVLIHRFVGMYSGRRMFRKQEEAQIGMVWPSYLIDAIISGGVREVHPEKWECKAEPHQRSLDDLAL